jgi:hypothetical protein
MSRIKNTTLQGHRPLKGGINNYVNCYFLCRTDGLHRANISASAAINAFIGVNFIDVTFADCFGRALSHAGTTSTALIANYISHINDI